MHYDFAMLTDRVRNLAYRTAIEHAVRKGDIVLDAGTGTGIFAVMAAQAGAHTVYAVEKRPIIAIARDVARRNGVEQKIQFIQGDIREIELPQKADIIISEMIGYVGLAEGMHELMNTMTTRHLKPGGCVIPRRITVFAAPVSHAALYNELMLTETVPGVDMGPVLDEIAHNYWVESLVRANVAADAAAVLSLDWSGGPAKRFEEQHVAFSINSDIAIHGLGTWFVVELIPGVAIDTAPAALDTHWKQSFFPFREPLNASAGDILNVSFRCIPAGEGEIFYWSYEHRQRDAIVASGACSNALTAHILKLGGAQPPREHFHREQF